MQARTGSQRCWSPQVLARGFTLIELLVVFTLLALLLTIAVPRYLQTVEKSREKARAQNIATLRDALDKFRADQGRYPQTLNELIVKQYLRQMPLDPVTETTEWTTVEDPSGREAGVYDIAAPTISSDGEEISNAVPHRADSQVPLPSGPPASVDTSSNLTLKPATP